MNLEYLRLLASSYGAAGSLGEALIAIFCIVAMVAALREAVKRMTARRPLGADARPEDASALSRVLRWLRPLIVAGVLLMIAFVFGGLALEPLLVLVPADWVVAYLVVFALGGTVGGAELISRYKDQPTRAVTTTPAVFYISLNALGSIAALYLIWTYREKLNFPPKLEDWTSGVIVQAVLIAGFSSLLFFRTSIFKLRVGDSDLAVGPSIVLDSLLTAADRAVDRVMAEPRAAFVHRVMAPISFEKAAVILPAHCLSLMQNVSSEESQRIRGVVDSLRANKDMPDKIKSLNLGLALLTVVGEDVLETAIEGLRDDLQDSTEELIKQVAKVMHPVSFERAARMLPPYCIALWPKSIQDDELEKVRAEAVALRALQDVPEDYKALILGIRLARLTDGATLRKAVEDLGTAIQYPPTAPPAVATGATATAQEGGPALGILT